MTWLATHNFFLFDASDSYRNPSGVLAALDLFFIKQPNSVDPLNYDRSFALSALLNTESLSELDYSEKPQLQDSDAASLVNETALLQTKSEELESQLSQTQQKLEQAQIKLKSVRGELKSSNQQIAQLRARIAAMETSKFWQIRRAWFKLKRALGLSTQE